MGAPWLSDPNEYEIYRVRDERTEVFKELDKLLDVMPWETPDELRDSAKQIAALAVRLEVVAGDMMELEKLVPP